VFPYLLSPLYIVPAALQLFCVIFALFLRFISLSFSAFHCALVFYRICAVRELLLFVSSSSLIYNVPHHIPPAHRPSGAGKSTLLDVIADRKLNGSWSGHVYINHKRRSTSFNKETAYCLQSDFHIATITVAETIRYAAWARMEVGTTSQQIEARVDLLLDMLGLTHVRDSLVGDELTKGLSGGQLKRLSIAVSIVLLPKLIFLDEPTR